MRGQRNPLLQLAPLSPSPESNTLRVLSRVLLVLLAPLVLLVPAALL